MTLYRILFLLLVVFVTRLQAADSYEFQLNGKPVKARFISLAGTPESAAPGDVVSLRDFAFVLDAPGRYVLHAPEKDSRRLFRVGEDGKETLLACRVGVEFPANDPKGEKRIWVNPLDGLSPAALAQLRGVRIEDWRPNLPAQLSKLDLARCLLGIHLFGGKEEGFAVGSIPPATRYLWIEQASNVGPTDLGELGKLNELRALCYESPLSDYDLQVLGPLHELRYLEISVRNNSVLHSESLSSLHELRALDLGSAKGLRDAEFLRSLGKLRWLDLQRTSIEDLRALGDLPQLAVVNAELSLVAHLPGQAMSSLREFHLMGAPVDEKDVAAFQKLNPQCSISHDWEAPLQKALAGADRVRVVSPPGGPMFASTGKPV